MSSNKSGVETGALAAAKAARISYSGYTHKPDNISRLFDLEEMKKVYEVSKKLIEEADMVIFVGPEGSAYRKLEKRVKSKILLKVAVSDVDCLKDLALSGKRVYITGVREAQHPGITGKVFENLKDNLTKAK